MKELVAGDEIPPGCSTIEVRVSELRRLFNPMDPSPFHERDLDPDTEEFIVGWSRELSRDVPVALLVHIDRSPGPPEEAGPLCEAVRQFFARRSAVSRQRLRGTFRIGRSSLLIGLSCLGLALGASQWLTQFLSPGGFVSVLNESLSIGGWVAMWKPIEIFLYEWWPIRGDMRLFSRLAAMPVQIRYADGPAAPLGAAR